MSEPFYRDEKNVPCPCCGQMITEREAQAAGLRQDPVTGKWVEPWEQYLGRTGQND